MTKSQKIKLMIIENFIDYYTTDEKEREEMKDAATTYVKEDWVDEIEQSFNKQEITKMKRAEIWSKQYDEMKSQIITDIWLLIKDREEKSLDIMKRKGIPAIVVNIIDDQFSETIDELIVHEDKVKGVSRNIYNSFNTYDLNEFEAPMLILILESVEKHLALEK
jgi:hypothetical protein